MLLFNSPAQASSQSGGIVTHVYVHSSGKALIDATGIRTTPIGCGTSGWAFDATTAAGQAMLSLFLSALHAGTPVEILGTGDCALWTDRETVLQGHIYR